MSKRRGLSLDEKRKRMQDMFFEKKSVFQLKEVEKIASKEKGITSMAIKDVLQSLVDDSLVDTDRIGTSNYFWSFPSKASQARKRKLDEITNQLQANEKRRKSVMDAVNIASVGREDTENRNDILKKLSVQESLNDKLQAELEMYKEVDPEVLEQIKKETITARDATNRWTENVFSIKSWCKRKFCVEEKMLDKQFGISEEFDYIE